MIYQDKFGNIILEEDLLKLNVWEIEELGIHIYEEELAED